MIKHIKRGRMIHSFNLILTLKKRPDFILKKWPNIISRTPNGGKKICRAKFRTTLRHSMYPQSLDS